SSENLPVTINRNEHQPLSVSGVKWRAFVQIFETVFSKILNVFCALLERTRHLFDKLLMPRWLSNLFPERVIAVVRATRQYEYRNWVGFVEPQQNCTFKLAYCRSLLVRYKKRRAKTRFGLFAPLATHLSEFRLSCWIREESSPETQRHTVWSWQKIGSLGSLENTTGR